MFKKEFDDIESITQSSRRGEQRKCIIAKDVGTGTLGEEE